MALARNRDGGTLARTAAIRPGDVDPDDKSSREISNGVRTGGAAHTQDLPERSGELDGDDEQAARRLVARAVVLAQAGDHDALAFLYKRYAGDIYGYVRSIVHDHHEAEDITQHVFAKLIAAIGSYRERGVPFFAWMRRVARNVAIDHIRRQRLVPVEEIRFLDAELADPRRETHISDIKEALATLPHAQREVLVLRHLAGLSPTEIAARTGRSEGSIHGLHHRGRRALFAELKSRDAAPATSRRPAHGSDELARIKLA